MDTGRVWYVLIPFSDEEIARDVATETPYITRVVDGRDEPGLRDRRRRPEVLRPLDGRARRGVALLRRHDLMGLALIIVRDEDDSVNISIEFEPTLKEGEDCTPAQAMALRFLDLLGATPDDITSRR